MVVAITVLLLWVTSTWTAAAHPSPGSGRRAGPEAALDRAFELVANSAEGGRDFRAVLAAAYAERRSASGADSSLHRVSLGRVLSGSGRLCRPLCLGTCWARPTRPSASMGVCRSLLLESEAVDDWRLAAVLLWTTTRASPAKSFAIEDDDVVLALLERTIDQGTFFPLHRRFLRRLPESALPPTDVLARFYAGPVRASIADGLVRVRATDDVPPGPGARIALPPIVADLWWDLVRCAAPDDVRAVAVLAQGDLPPQTWSILFFEAVARLCGSATGLLDLVVPDSRYQKHLFAEAVARAYRPGPGLYQCLSHWIRLRSWIDPNVLESIERELLLDWVERFFREFPRAALSDALKLDAFQHLLSHLSVADLEALFLDLLVRDSQSRRHIDDEYDLMLAPDATECPRCAYRIARQIDANYLDLAGPLHYLLLGCLDVQYLYEDHLHTSMQCYRVVLSIAFWRSSAHKWHSSSYLSDAFLSQCVYNLSDLAMFGADLFANDSTGRPDLILKLISKGSEHLTDTDRYGATEIQFHSARYPRPPQTAPFLSDSVLSGRVSSSIDSFYE